MVRILTALVLAALSGCSLTSSGGAAEAILSSGTSYGECMGYCVTDLVVEDDQATLTYSGWTNGATLPDIEHQRTLDVGERQRLNDALDLDALRRADAVYGCPDCADGGAEWVGADTGGGMTRVTFDAGAEVGGLDSYIVAMRALRSSFPSAPRL